MNFGANFKRVCNEHGTSPTMLLTKLGLSTSKVAAYNTGSIPKAETLQQFAQALDCQVWQFFTDGKPEYVPADTSTFITQDEEQILAIYRSMSRREQHEFMVQLYHRDPQS